MNQSETFARYRVKLLISSNGEREIVEMTVGTAGGISGAVAIASEGVRVLQVIAVVRQLNPLTAAAERK